MKNPGFLIYKAGSECIYIMSLFQKQPLQLFIRISLRSEKNFKKQRSMHQTRCRKLAGNPRSNPMGKDNDLWEKLFFCIMRRFYKDIMRFCCFCYLSSDVREFCFCFSPLISGQPRSAVFRCMLCSPFLLPHLTLLLLSLSKLSK